MTGSEPRAAREAARDALAAAAAEAAALCGTGLWLESGAAAAFGRLLRELLAAPA